MERRQWDRQLGLPISIILIGILIFCSACRFELPTRSEGRALAQSGAFPVGNPSWVPAGPGDDPSAVSSAGIIPRGFASSRAASARRATRGVTNPGEVQYRNELSARSQEANTAVTNPAVVDAPEGKVEESSPLARISATCPSLESSVNKALTEVNLSNRIKMYTKLSRRCPDSPDLLLWLAQDYEAADKVFEAKQTYQRVLAVDRTNKTAKDALSRLGN